VLAQQPLAARKSTLTFAREIFGGMLRQDRELALQVLDVLEMLLSSYRYRHSSSRYAGYQPTPPDQLRELASYSANLATLRVTFEPEGESIPLMKLLRTQQDALERWRSAVALWKAGLSTDGLQSVLAVLELSDDKLSVGVNSHGGRWLAFIAEGDLRQSGVIEVQLARLAGDPMLEELLRYGSAIVDGYSYSFGGDWVNVMASWLIPAIAGKRVPSLIERPAAEVPDRDVRIIAELIFRYLRIARCDREMDIEVLRLLFDLPQVFQIDYETLAAVAASDTALLDEIPELRDPENYGGFAVFIGELFPDAALEVPSDEALARGRDIIEQLTRRRQLWNFDHGDES
jgi:hypothetical protein